jgi:uncharacterized protein (TIGR03086 family)
MSKTRWDVLDRAHGVLRAAVAGVGPDQWAIPTPCQEWSVAQVFGHALGDQQAYAGSLTGTGFPEENPFAPSGNLPAQPAATLDDVLAGTAAAFADVPADDPAVAVPLPQGPLSAPVAVAAAALDAAVHGWDIAVATGQRPLLDDALAAELTTFAGQIVEPVRAFAFAPALASADDDGALAALLKYLGRDPGWTA